jgi:hypothetical protein
MCTRTALALALLALCACSKPEPPEKERPPEPQATQVESREQIREPIDRAEAAAAEVQKAADAQRAAIDAASEG